jgi:phage shock protein PspC (stress-responsive transcriptional regulator)
VVLGERQIEGDPMKESAGAELRRQLREWSRDPEGKKIAGVCAGLSNQLDVPVTAVRAIFVLLALPSFSSVGIVLYLILWFLMPASSGEESGLDRVVGAVSSLAGDASSDPSDEEDAFRVPPR